jgi:hypothetical protein
MKDEGVQNLIIRLGEDAQIMRGASGFPTIAAEIAEAASALSTLLQEREALRKALANFLAPMEGKPAYPGSTHGFYVTGQVVLIARSALSPEKNLVQPAADRGGAHCDHPISEDEATKER